MKISYKNLTMIYFLLGAFSTQSMAKSTNINNEELQTFANKIKMLSSKELNELSEIIRAKKPKEHIHNIITKEDVTTKEVKSKIKKQTSINDILTALGQLAKKEGTDTACQFCSAILADVTVNKVEVVNMGQDWVELRIKKGDTLANLSKKYYGDAKKFKIISKLKKNNIAKNNIIYAGKVLTIPRIESLKEQNKKGALSCKFCAALLADSSLGNIRIVSENSDYVEIEVKRGDMLSSLARKYYGKASAYLKIYNANRDKMDENYLIFPGMVLKIPKI